MGDNAVDKVDMSLDDIIKQNRKEKREAARQGRNKKVTRLIGKPGARAALALKAVRGRGRGARGAGTSTRGAGTSTRGAGRGARRGGATGRGGRGRGGGAGVGRLNRQGGAQQTGANRPQNQRSQLNSLRKQKLQQARQRLQQQQQRQQQQNRQNKQFQNRGLQQPQQQRGRGRGRGGGRGRGQLNRRGALQGFQGNRQQQQQQQQSKRKWNNTPRGPPPAHILTVSVPNPLAKGAAPPQKNQSFSRGFNNAGNKGGFKTLSDRFSATQQTSARGQQVRGRGGRRGRGGGRGRGRGGGMGRMVTLH